MDPLRFEDSDIKTWLRGPHHVMLKESLSLCEWKMHFRRVRLDRTQHLLNVEITDDFRSDLIASARMWSMNWPGAAAWSSANSSQLVAAASENSFHNIIAHWSALFSTKIEKNQQMLRYQKHEHRYILPE